MRIADRSPKIRGVRPARQGFQCTFVTPLKDLERFVSTALRLHPPADSARIILDQVVFEPDDLNALLATHSIFEDDLQGVALEAVGPEVEGLLLATLADWIDFSFVPSPSTVTIYADHDDFTTFFARKPEIIQRVAEALEARGFERVDYERQ